jgi:hypothetical protein
MGSNRIAAPRIPAAVKQGINGLAALVHAYAVSDGGPGKNVKVSTFGKLEDLNAPMREYRLRGDAIVGIRVSRLWIMPEVTNKDWSSSVHGWLSVPRQSGSPGEHPHRKLTTGLSSIPFLGALLRRSVFA